jgi:bifunctional non-homologous end joining protein LigD
MTGSLKDYERKRDFKVTSEPKPRRGRTRGSSFVIQKHAARRLHYDFRLELDGVLKSWAVARGPSLVPGEKRLAVHVEDHPLDYGTFEGTIPEGQYGAGSVMLWDRGTWIPEGDPHKAYDKGHLDFSLDGEKLHGRWHLVRMRGKPGEKHENWLLIKSEDDAARHASDADILEEEDRSVTTGRTIEEIGKDRKSRQWSSNKEAADEPTAPARATLSPKRRIAEALRGSPAPKPAAAATKSAAAARKPTVAKAKPPPAKPSARKTARPRAATKAVTRKRAHADTDAESHSPSLPSGLHKAPLAYVSPQLAQLAERAPEGAEWLHELKFDGYRMQAIKANGEARMWTRRGLDWTERFQPIAEAVETLSSDGVHLDGEIVVEDQAGISDFSQLQDVLKQGHSERLVYYVFDLLALDGKDLRHLPLLERKSLLQSALEGCDPVLRFSEHFEVAGGTMLAQVCTLGAEGIVSKRRDRAYKSGRTGDWLKAKCANRQEFVVAGFVPSTTSRKSIGSLILGYYRAKALIYAGRVGTGFSSDTASSLFKTLEAMRRSTPAFAATLPADARRGAVWTEPELVAEIEFRGWTGGEVLRQASFKGIREDKDPREIVREIARSEPVRQARAPTIRLTHPDRLLWPEAGITKEGLCDYYAEAWPMIAPHVTRRPLALVRCPMGTKAACFFQKHAWKGIPDVIRQYDDPQDDEKVLGIEDLDGLLALVQSSVLEIHPWGASIDHLDQPDRLVFDLDPGEGVTWPEIVAGADEVRHRLRDLKLESFVKTSGGKGLHVVVPLVPTVDWDTAKAFCQSISLAMAKDSPDRFVATMSKAARPKRIYVDYLRNGRGATAVCAYSARAREKAGISVPLAWSELPATLSGEQFTLVNINHRLQHLKREPWPDFSKIKQTLSAHKRVRR